MNFLHKGGLRFLAVNVQSELENKIVFFIAPAVQKICAQIFLLRKIKFKRGCKIIFSCLSGYCILLPSVQKFFKQLFSFQNCFKKSLRLKIRSLSWPS
jgi:hypothetical protein